MLVFRSVIPTKLNSGRRFFLIYIAHFRRQGRIGSVGVARFWRVIFRWLWEERWSYVLHMHLMKSLKMSTENSSMPSADGYWNCQVQSNEPSQIRGPHGFGRCSKDTNTQIILFTYSLLKFAKTWSVLFRTTFSIGMPPQTSSDTFYGLLDYSIGEIWEILLHFGCYYCPVELACDGLSMVGHC